MQKHDVKKWWIFCQVIDNFGDIGVCFRLAKQLVAEYQYEVVLWVDDLISFAKLCPQVDPLSTSQDVCGIRVLHWDSAKLLSHIAEQANPDVLIEAFACDLPEVVVGVIVKHHVFWLNLEYLSAEEWVEGCHLMASPQKYGTNKYFFFPGLTSKTGGLLRERDISTRREAFLADTEAQNTFRQHLGLNRLPERDSAPLVISLFTYTTEVLSLWIDTWVDLNIPISVLVPEGIALESLGIYFGKEPRLGDSVQVGQLSITVIPFVPQSDFDSILWLSDLNIVRGEDSFVRAHWAEQPFFWHIYPQDEEAHKQKLHAFWQRAYTCFASDILGAHQSLSDELNGIGLLEKEARNHAWQILFDHYDLWQRASQEWSTIQKQLPDMAQQLAKLVKN